MYLRFFYIARNGINIICIFLHEDNWKLISWISQFLVFFSFYEPKKLINTNIELRKLSGHHCFITLSIFIGHETWLLYHTLTKNSFYEFIIASFKYFWISYILKFGSNFSWAIGSNASLQSKMAKSIDFLYIFS
jgi:hypothetical protein